MSLEHILLGLLGEPGFGYELKDRFENSAAHFWSAELSQIYPALQKLETNHYARSLQEPSPKGPPRRVYERTKKGRNRLREWVASGPDIGSERYAYLAQLYFMDELGSTATALEFMSRLRDHYEERLAALEHIEKILHRECGNDPLEMDSANYYPYAVLRMGLAKYGATLAWTEKLVGELEQRLAREEKKE